MKPTACPDDLPSDAILRHPGFNTTHRAFLTEYNLFQTDTPRANRVLDNQARVILCNCILHLHYRHLNGHGRFPTPGCLQGMMEELGLYSARGVDLALSELRAARFVAIVARDEDRRVSQVTPTPELIAFYRRYARVPLAALDRLMPGRQYLSRFEQLPELFDYMSLLASERRTRAISPMRRPDTFAIMQHTGGYRLLTELLEMAHCANNDAPESVLLQIGIDTIAAHCHVSRSQTRLLLEEAVQHGLIAHERRAVYRVTRLLVDTLAAHFVQILRHMERNFDAATCELARRHALTMHHFELRDVVALAPAPPDLPLPFWCQTSDLQSYPH